MYAAQLKLGSQPEERVTQHSQPPGAGCTWVRVGALQENVKGKGKGGLVQVGLPAALAGAATLAAAPPQGRGRKARSWKKIKGAGQAKHVSSLLSPHLLSAFHWQVSWYCASAC